MEISDLAEQRFDKFLEYIYNVLMNPQAAVSLIQDFDDTIKILSTVQNLKTGKAV